MRGSRRPATMDRNQPPQPGDGGKAELLRGLHEVQQQLQGEQADQLQRLYEKGPGAGMGAGGVF